MDKSSDNCDVQVTIVLPSKTFHVSKKLICSKIPYFEKMFSNGFKESEENRVELNLDVKMFQEIIFYLNGYLLIHFKDVIPLYDIADFLLIDDLKDECTKFFTKVLDKFNIDHVFDILNQVTETSKLINSKTMDSFVSRHFLRTINARTFVHCTYKVLDRILGLDLWIDSEFQVFEAIVEWVKYDTDSRKQHLPHLFKHIRWSYVVDQDLQKIKSHDLVKQLKNFSEPSLTDQKIQSRIAQNVLVALFYGENSSKQRVLDLYYYAGAERWYPLKNFTEDLDLCKHVIGTENLLIDMFYGYGRQLIRLDLTNSTFCQLNPISHIKSLVPKEKGSLFFYFNNRNGFGITNQENITVFSFIESSETLFFTTYYDYNHSYSCYWPKKYFLEELGFSDTRSRCVAITSFNGNVCMHFGGECLTCLDISNKNSSSISLTECNLPYDISSSSMSLAGNETTLMIADKNTNTFYVRGTQKTDWIKFEIFTEKKLEAITSLRIPRQCFGINSLIAHE